MILPSLLPKVIETIPALSIIRPCENDALLRGSGGSDWNSNGMHHFDVHQLNDSSWIAAVDGCSFI